MVCCYVSAESKRSDEKCRRANIEIRWGNRGIGTEFAKVCTNYTDRTWYGFDKLIAEYIMKGHERYKFKNVRARNGCLICFEPSSWYQYGSE
jgi:hypothetical protein